MLTVVDYERAIRNQDAETALDLLVQIVPPPERKDEVLLRMRKATKEIVELERKGWNGIWARIVTNFLMTMGVGCFDAVVGNPPWIDWKNLPSGYRDRVKGLCIERGLFSGDKRTGGINLNICALISFSSAQHWLVPRPANT
jgi:hypothetical protein